MKLGKDFDKLACEICVAKATAEVYGIDCLAAGQSLDHEKMAEYLKISSESFRRIQREILCNEDQKLCTIRDNLNEAEYSYNQIRFVLACLIQKLEM